MANVTFRMSLSGWGSENLLLPPPANQLQVESGLLLVINQIAGLEPEFLLGEGNGNPLQYSCLEIPMDGGTWQVTVHGAAKSRTRLSGFTFTFTTMWETWV